MALYIVTGVAGFIASRVAHQLLEKGDSVIGVDNLNDAYDVRLKEWRLAMLQRKAGFKFHQVDITDLSILKPLFNGDIKAVVNLAARAGVRQSVENPLVYQETNIIGTLNLLE